PVHLVEDGGAQHRSEHRAVNPMRQVPVLLEDGVPLAQSMAILEYIEERHPSPPLLPSDPVARARVRQLAEVINSGIQPLQNLRTMQRLRNDFGLSAEQARAWCRGWIEEGFEAVNALVGMHGGAFCVGDEVSFADLCLVPQLYNARRFAVALEPYPGLTAIEARLQRLPAFVQAHPQVQPDAV
ncbi:MAG: maleylacetoacetate isomerase, partial [Myxococcota bacterium]|nr:maleylacetoacetate isomerase [Myxococcota bacterium]